jgi:hypothetical protein
VRRLWRHKSALNLEMTGGNVYSLDLVLTFSNCVYIFCRSIVLRSQVIQSLARNVAMKPGMYALMKSECATGLAAKHDVQSVRMIAGDSCTGKSCQNGHHLWCILSHRNTCSSCKPSTISLRDFSAVSSLYDLQVKNLHRNAGIVDP